MTRIFDDKLPRLLLVTLLAAGACTDGSPEDQSEQASSIRYGVDYAWARPSPATLHAQGYTFAARYLSYDTTGKNLSHAEADALINAGLDVVTVWEQGATNALGGYGQGVSDAQAAKAQALADGEPADRAIYFAVDFDATPGDQVPINAYLDGAASVIGRSRTGVYGGYYVVKRAFDAGKITWGWQTYAWSGGQWDARAQLRQIQNGIAGGQEDEDEAVSDDFGQWGHVVVDNGPPPAAPPLPTQCGAIEPGHGLSRGQSWSSCDQRFTLAMQTDGNLVLYSSGVALWATGTYGRGGSVAVMQTDGNFVLYSDHSHPLFASGTYGHGGAYLAIQGDGNAVVYAGTTALWASNTGGLPPGPTACGAIAAGHGLAPGEAVHSCNGVYTFVQQGDGNLVLYHGAHALWATGTNGGPARHTVMQGDGNLVTYVGGLALWSSHTYGHGGATLAVQDDGNVVIYESGHALWATGTNGQ